MNKLFLGFVLISAFVDAQDLNWSPFHFNDDTVSVILSNTDFYTWFYPDGSWTRMIKNRKKSNDGFLQINDIILPQTDRMYVIEGKNVIIFEEYLFPWDWTNDRLSLNSQYDEPLIVKDLTLNEWITKKYSLTNTHITSEGWNKVSLFNDGLEEISTSSSLEEIQPDGSVISYNGQSVKDKLFFLTGDGTIDLYYDNLTPPWVEGVEGYGIGEYLDIEFKYASDEIQVLNGFVDFRRMHLYKDNSRVRRVRIESAELKFSAEYELEDIVRYNLIRLPQRTARIRMTILDVYPGRKWKDTAISSILVTDPNQVPYEEQKEKLIAMMKANGVWDKIEEYKREMNTKDAKR